MDRIARTTFSISIVVLLAIAHGCGSGDAVFLVAPQPEGRTDDATAGDTAHVGDADDTLEPDADTAAEDARSGDDTPAPDTTPLDLPDLPAPEFETGLRLVHLSPDAPELDLYIDGEAVELFEDLAYLDVRPGQGDADPYFRLETRTISVALVPNGARIDDAIYTAEWPLSRSVEYTIWLHGLTAVPLPEGAQGFDIGFTVDDTGAPPPGAGRIRFFNALVGLPSLDFFISDTLVAEEIQFGFFLLDYLLISSASYVYAFAPSGTRDTLVEAPVLFGEETTNVFAVGDAIDGEVMLYGLRQSGEVGPCPPACASSTRLRSWTGPRSAASISTVDPSSCSRAFGSVT